MILEWHLLVLVRITVYKFILAGKEIYLTFDLENVMLILS